MIIESNETKIQKEDLIQPSLLPRAGIMVIVGDTGAGTSWLAQLTAIQLATDQSWLSQFPVNGQNNVLLVNAHHPHHIYRKRLHLSGWDNAYRSVTGTITQHDGSSLYLDTKQGLSELNNLVKRSKAQIVIGDRISDLTAGASDESILKTMTNCRGFCLETGTSMVLVHFLWSAGCKLNKFWGIEIDDHPSPKNVPKFDIVEPVVDTIVAITELPKCRRRLTFLKHHFPFFRGLSLDLEFRPGTPLPFFPVGTV